jgi:hypothetical protein
MDYNQSFTQPLIQGPDIITVTVTVHPLLPSPSVTDMPLKRHPMHTHNVQKLPSI